MEGHANLMKKKIDVKDLLVGMYVCEADRPWLETPFMFQGFPLHSLEDIEAVRQVCSYVYIDTERGKDAAGSVTAHKASRKLEREMIDNIPHPSQESTRYPITTSLQEELPVARRVHDDTRSLIQGFTNDIRLGKSIDTAAAKQTVGEMVETIVHNPNALLCFTELKNRDEYTSIHSMNVCVMALVFGRHLGLDKDALNELGIGALLHDLGKLKVPLEILNKPGKLTDEEKKIMDAHPVYGREILEKSGGVPRSALDIAYSHHERSNGKGYPEGRRSFELSLFSKIVAIVDVYDAITSDRPYHNGMASHEALKRMYEWRKTDFDVELVEKFIQCLGIYPVGSVVELNTGDVGLVVEVDPAHRLKPKILLVMDPDKQLREDRKVIDLVTDRVDYTEQGAALEIVSVLDPGQHRVRLAEYMFKPPLMASA